jgi:hypothetical protein
MFMKNLIATLRQKWLMWKIEREIYGCIFPYLRKEKNGDYPFRSDKELQKIILHGKLDAQLHLATIERQADEMGKAYGEAFRYIMYRDLNKRMLRYARLVQKRVPPRARVSQYATA